jgi:hypothetical protein
MEGVAGVLLAILTTSVILLLLGNISGAVIGFVILGTLLRFLGELL